MIDSRTGKTLRGVALLAVAMIGSVSCSGPTASDPQSHAPATLDEVVASLTNSVNLSGLEHAPGEGDWWEGGVLTDALLDEVAAAGFTGVRLPVRFSGHQGLEPPYEIDPEYMARVEWAVDGLTSRGLTVIVDVQGWGLEGRSDYDLLFTDPEAEHDRFLALWEQVAEAFADRDERVVFEILNEPHDALSDVWNDYQAEALAIIRETNPTRAVIVSPVDWSSAWSLDDLILPDDPNIIVTFHHYEPRAFTHQGADWAGLDDETGIEWPSESLGPRPAWFVWASGGVVEWTTDGLLATFHDPWSMVGFTTTTPVDDAVALSFTADAAIDAQVHCPADDDEPRVGARVTASAGERVTVAVDRCRNGSASGTEPFVEFWIQIGEEVPGPFTITDARVVTPAGDLALIFDAEQQMAYPILLAAAYGVEHDVPMFMGEYGAYEAAPMDSRIRWTETARRIAQENGIATAYWEFDGEFGVFDPVSWSFREDLVQAVLGE